MAIERMGDVEASVAATDEKHVAREPHLIEPPIVETESGKQQDARHCSRAFLDLLWLSEI